MSFLKGFTSVFDWMFPPRTLDEHLQDLYDDMGWGKYQNPNEEYAKVNTGWTIITDDRVRHVWFCPDCGFTDSVGPDYYADSGTPMCMATDDDSGYECDADMDYSHTEIYCG